MDLYRKGSGLAKELLVLGLEASTRSLSMRTAWFTLGVSITLRKPGLWSVKEKTSLIYCVQVR